MTAQKIIGYMESLRDEEQRENLMRFFKTAPGEYGYGDEFLGLKVPQTRDVVKAVAKDISLDEVPELLMSKWHEVRLCGLLILVGQFEKLATKRLENDVEAIKKRDEIVTMYLQNAEQANNWDLVDLSVHKILGHWLLLPSNLGDKDYKIKVLDELAKSDNLWKQRMSIVCTWKTSQQGDSLWCLRYAEIHLHHPHDLMHKAVGWMLREMGKRCSMDLLRGFLRQNAHEMPRTMLRYAIEKMSDEERKQWMAIPMQKMYHSVSIISPFDGVNTPEILDIILHDAKQSDEAVYYLLHHRCERQLHEIYEAYRHRLLDDFDDILDDFFLYLREGKDGQSRYPYQSLQSIQKKDSFRTWLLNTFRNYLHNRVEAEESLYRLSDTIADEASPSVITDEQRLTIASQLIAYAHQVFFPRGRFIFLRSMLTMLNKQKALPDNEVAEALQMTHLAYRVMAHRMKQNLALFRNRLLQGEQLRLDTEHLQMARQIYDDFTHLYPTLLAYYNLTVDSLYCAEAIRQLRQEYYERTGMMAHEPNSDYPVVTSIGMFWNKLNRLLIV